MQRHFVQELETLKTKIIRMGSFVEQAVKDACRAMVARRADIARQVVAQEDRINALEVEIDNDVVDLLALQQPVASDLRLILAAMKINNDLERIGDHAVNIAESAIASAERPALASPTDIPRMAELAASMLRDALDGFIHNTPALCRGVLANDDAVDELNKKTIRDLVEIIRSDPTTIEQALDLIRVSRNLERVADLTTNIAEEVIFIAEAQVVKHHLEKKDGAR